MKCYTFNVIVKRDNSFYLNGYVNEQIIVQAENLDKALISLDEKIKNFGLCVKEIKPNYFEDGLSRIMKNR